MLILSALFLFLTWACFATEPPDVIAETLLLTAPKSEHSWPYWSWGSESTVSIVDKSPAVTFASRPASFGPELSTPVLGYIILVSDFAHPCIKATEEADVATVSPDNTGCPRLCVPNHSPDETWIALVQRGSCSFVEKVREAQRLGAHAVVIGGDDPEVFPYNPDTLVNMYAPTDSSDITISSTYIKYSDYVELREAIATSNTSHSGLRTLSLLLNTEYSAWEWYSPIITFTIILLLPSTLTFITLLIHRVRATRAAQLERAPEDVVRNLPWRVHTGTGWEKHEGGEPVSSASADVDLEDASSVPDEPVQQSTSTQAGVEQPWFENQTECAICLSEFVKGDRVRVLPCNHIFHLVEVDEWLLERKKLCPICKADVTRPPVALPLPFEATVVDESALHDALNSDTEASVVVDERTPLLARAAFS